VPQRRNGHRIRVGHVLHALRGGPGERVPPHRGTLPRRLIGRPPQGAHFRHVGVFTVVLRGRSRHFPAIVNHLPARGEVSSFVEKRNKPCRDAAIHPAGVISSRKAYPHQTHLSVARILWRRSARGAGCGGGILDSPRVFLGKLLRFAQQTPLGYERVPSSVVLSCLSLALPFTLSPFSLAGRDVVDVSWTS